MRAYERFLKYISIDTQSDEASSNCPSTKSQIEFGKIIADDMKHIGIKDVFVDENGYVYGEIPCTKGMENSDVIGFIAHMDTSPSYIGSNINPKIIENYNGKDIVLNNEKSIVMKTDMFSHLKSYVGKSLIVTDGTTLLGADDKAGISEILTAAEVIINNNIPHGTIKIAFTPDEEIGRGADLFDVKRFNADYAYTVDGGGIGELEYENFNAASAEIKVHGINIHPGEAKNKMKNASLLAMEFNSMIPKAETPAHTEGYEGFYHLCHINGNEETASLSYIIRDHDKNKFEFRKNTIENIGKFLNGLYGQGIFEISIKDSYYNMREKIEPCMHIVDKVAKAMKECGVEPIIKPIRGGTDGARLSFMGLPCPNISTGGHNFHGKFEYIPIESMDKIVEVIVKILNI